MQFSHLWSTTNVSLFTWNIMNVEKYFCGPSCYVTVCSRKMSSGSSTSLGSDAISGLHLTSQYHSITTEQCTAGQLSSAANWQLYQVSSSKGHFWVNIRWDNFFWHILEDSLVVLDGSIIFLIQSNIILLCLNPLKSFLKYRFQNFKFENHPISNVK